MLLSLACPFFLYMAIKGILNPFHESRFDSYVIMMLVFAIIYGTPKPPITRRCATPSRFLPYMC